MPAASPPVHASLPRDAFRWVDEPVRHWAAAAPGQVAVADRILTLTCRDLDAAVDAVATRLLALGAGPGERVLIVLENSVAAVVAVLAATRIRAWAVPVNARLSPREIDEIIAHCGPKLTLYTNAVSAEAAAHGARHGARDDPLLGALGASVAAGAGSGPEPVAGTPAGQVAALIYTSGTTGAPKAVMLSHDNLVFIAGRSSEARRLDRADRVYGVLPISHVFGLASVMLGTLYQGGRLDLAPRFDAEECARALAEDGITVFLGAPQMHARLLALAKTRGGPVRAPTLRCTSAGGAPLDLALKHQIEEMWGIPLLNGYGLSEASPTVATTTLDQPAKDHSCGRPLPDVEVRIADPQGRPLPPGAVGEILVRGRLVMRGYYRDPEATARTVTADGWLRTGDLGRLTEAGDLYVEGRLKELIIRSGFNVHPPEVEGVLTAHPDVALAAVIGRPVDGNEEVVAFVQPVPGRTLDLAALRAFAAARLAPYKRPAEYRVMTELPATATGKLLKAKLRDLL